MKKNKLFNSIYILLLPLLLFLIISCSSDESSFTPLPEKEVVNGNMTNKISVGIEINENIARTVASTYYANASGLNRLNVTVKSVRTILDDSNALAIYAVNIEPSGFVLVSSNTKNVAVTAYSPNSTFVFDNSSSEGLKSWIAESILLNNKLETMEDVKEIDNQWYDLSIGAVGRPPISGGSGNGGGGTEIIQYLYTVNQQVGPLLQTTWGQNSLYNQYVPGNHPTGCVATATAQVMRYYKWPNAFDWVAMGTSSFPNSLNASLATSALMSNIGQAVNMNYSNPLESSAYTSDARNALVINYGYSSQANYSPYTLANTKNEILLNRPVIIDGKHTIILQGWWFWQSTTYDDGHSWVCDGYKQQYDVYVHNPNTTYQYTTQEDRFEWLHMNWGWDGNNNGWFFRNNVSIAGVLVNGATANFQFNRNCIYKIKKP